MKWMKMGEKLPARTTYDKFGKLLIISAIEERDEGKYKCTAKSSAGEVVHYFDVIVEGWSHSFCTYLCFCFDTRGWRLFWLKPTCPFLTSPRSAKVATRASSEPAGRGWFWCSHQVLGQWETTTEHHLEEERKSVSRWVTLILVLLLCIFCHRAWGRSSEPPSTLTKQLFLLAGVFQIDTHSGCMLFWDVFQTFIFVYVRQTTHCTAGECLMTS